MILAKRLRLIVHVRHPRRPGVVLSLSFCHFIEVARIRKPKDISGNKNVREHPFRTYWCSRHVRKRAFLVSYSKLENYMEEIDVQSIDFMSIYSSDSRINSDFQITNLLRLLYETFLDSTVIIWILILIILKSSRWRLIIKNLLIF